MAVKILQFLFHSVASGCLMPAGVHIFALPGKIDLEAEAYLTVQQIYRGRALFGIAIVAAIISSCMLAFLSRRQPLAMWLALAGGLLIAATLVIFFLFVFPGNQATENWTVLPANWEELRTRWEYGHAANAGLTLFGFIALVLSALSRAE